jgi:geranylgeranyl transferase type-1 subunit beta
MLNDWSGVDIPRAIAFISSCRVHNFSPYETLPQRLFQTYEGGYGQAPFCEAQGSFLLFFF